MTTDPDARLLDLASRLGVRIEYGRLRDGRDGEWIPAYRTIRLLPDMHARRHRSVLAHELAHATFGDHPTPFGHLHRRQERRAETWAALTLIDPDAYRAAEFLCSGHPGAMAIELGVMRATVDTYRTLLRAGRSAYTTPQPGAGQRVA